MQRIWQRIKIAINAFLDAKGDMDIYKASHQLVYADLIIYSNSVQVNKAQFHQQIQMKHTSTNAIK
jgi:hypothetical protein